MPLAQVQETLLRVPEEYLIVANEYLISLINRAKTAEKNYDSFSNPAMRVLNAFDDAKVSVPITWTRDEINERE